MSDKTVEELMTTALKHRFANGRHLHHRDCIHNMPSEDQIAMRGKTVEWWMAFVGSMPEQITPGQWECESPFGSERPDGGAS